MHSQGAHPTGLHLTRACAGACCRGSYDLIGRVYASGAMGVPLALHVLSGDAGERVVYGDSRGAAVLLLCGSRELPPRDLISTETHKVRLVSIKGGSCMAHTAAEQGQGAVRQVLVSTDVAAPCGGYRACRLFAGLLPQPAWLAACTPSRQFASHVSKQ